MLVAALVIVANRFSIPFPVLLVLGGLALSFVPFLPPIRLNPEVVFFLFLPPLLYPAALFTSWRDFRRNLRPILFLAIGLVLLTMTVVAWVAPTFVAGWPWAAAVALGAVVAPPGAVGAEEETNWAEVPMAQAAAMGGGGKGARDGRSAAQEAVHRRRGVGTRSKTKSGPCAGARGAAIAAFVALLAASTAESWEVFMMWTIDPSGTSAAHSIDPSSFTESGTRSR